MPTVQGTVTLRTGATKGSTGTSGSDNTRATAGAVLSQVSGEKRRFRFPYAPLQVALERNAIQYNEVERPGRKPLLEPKQYQLRQVSFEAVLVDKDNPTEMDIQSQITTLRAMAKEDVDLRFSYDGTVKNVTWRMTELTIEVARRNKHNRPTLAKATITLTETSRILNKVVPGMSRIVISHQPISSSNGGSGSETNSPSDGTINGGDEGGWTDIETGGGS